MSNSRACRCSGQRLSRQQSQRLPRHPVVGSHHDLRMSTTGSDDPLQPRLRGATQLLPRSRPHSRQHQPRARIAQRNSLPVRNGSPVDRRAAPAELPLRRRRLRPADAVRAAAAARARGARAAGGLRGAGSPGGGPPTRPTGARSVSPPAPRGSTAALSSTPAQHGTCIAQGGRGIDRTGSHPQHAQGPSGLRRTRASQCTERIAEYRGAAGR